MSFAQPSTHQSCGVKIINDASTISLEGCGGIVISTDNDQIDADLVPVFVTIRPHVLSTQSEMTWRTLSDGSSHRALVDVVCISAESPGKAARWTKEGIVSAKCIMRRSKTVDDTPQGDLTLGLTSAPSWGTMSSRDGDNSELSGADVLTDFPGADNLPDEVKQAIAARSNPWVYKVTFTCNDTQAYSECDTGSDTQDVSEFVFCGEAITAIVLDFNNGGILCGGDSEVVQFDAGGECYDGTALRLSGLKEVDTSILGACASRM